MPIHEHSLLIVSLHQSQDARSSVFLFQNLNRRVLKAEFLEVVETKLDGLFLKRTVFPVRIEGPGFVGDFDEVFNGGNEGLFDVSGQRLFHSSKLTHQL